MRVVIACCGLEHMKRGYESFARELFGALSGHVEVTLCKGSGKGSPNEVVIPCLRRDFLLRFMNPQAAFRWEQITFAVALLPYLLLKRIDIVHYSEGTMGNVLARLLHLTGSRVRLLLSNGGPYHPKHFRADILIHQVTKDALDQAIECGVNPSRMYLAPYGIAPERFKSPESRDVLRQRFGFPSEKFLILSLAALNMEHKRLDYLIREVAALDDASVILCMAGQPTSETPELRDLAARLLPGRHTFMTLPRARILELLAAADLFVLPSLSEGFGMVFLEACSAGVPVVCHDSSQFQWVLGPAGIYVDMAVAGALTEKMRELITGQEVLERFSDLGKARVENDYSWRVLIPRYLEMYTAVLGA